MVGFRAGTGVPAARNFATEYENSAIATATRDAPSVTASIPGRNGSGVASWRSVPVTIEIRYTNGGRMRPRLATSDAVFEEPLVWGMVVMVLGLEAAHRADGVVKFRSRLRIWIIVASHRPRLCKAEPERGAHFAWFERVEVRHRISHDRHPARSRVYPPRHGIAHKRVATCPGALSKAVPASRESRELSDIEPARPTLRGTRSVWFVRTAATEAVLERWPAPRSIECDLR